MPLNPKPQAHGKRKIQAGVTSGISGVTAGTNLNGGGNSGTVTVNLDTNITGDIAFDTNVLKIDASNNRVGILNASPAYELDLNGRFFLDGGHFRGADTNGPSMRDETPSGTNPVFTFNNDVDTGMGRAAANTLSFVTEGRETVRMASDSNYSKLFIGADSTLGFYRYSNRLDFYVASNPRLHLDSGKLYSATSGGPLLDLTPTSGEANYGFVDDPDTGMSRTGANTLALMTGGTNAITIDSSQNVVIPANLTVQGTTTTIDSTTLSVKDKNIEMGVVSSPTDVTADGGGITLKGTTDKTFNWVDSTDSWTSSENLALASGKNLTLNGDGVGLSIKDGDGTEIVRLQTASGDEGLLYLRGPTGGNSIYLDGNSDSYINNGANLGIGTTSPGQKLDVDGNLRVRDSHTLAAGDADDLFLYHDGNSTIRSDSGTFQINQNTSSDFSLNSNGGDIIIDSNIYNKNNGNVGIGTSAPYQKLDIRGSLAVDNEINFDMDNNATAYGYINWDGYQGGDTQFRSLWIGDGRRQTQSTHPLAFFDGTTRQVGIGTVTPLAAIHINGGAYQQVFTRGSHNHTIVKGNSDDTLTFATGAPGSHTARFKIKPTGIDVVNDAIITGSVGIGTTSPQQPLHVLTSANDKGILIDVSDDTHEGRLIFGDTSSNAVGHIGYNHSLNALRFHTNGGSEALRLESDQDAKFYGKLGIGTTPSTALHIAGSGDQRITLGSTSSNSSKLILSSDGGAERIDFSLDGVGNMLAMTETGRIGIGTTSPGSKLDIVSTSNDNTGGIRIGDGSTFAAIYHDSSENLIIDPVSDFIVTGSDDVRIQSSDDFELLADDFYFKNDADNSTMMRITSAGNVGIGTTTPNSLLEVNGSSPKIIVDGGGSDDASIELRESANFGGRMYYDGDNNIFMKFTTIDGGTEKIRMAYDRDGNVYLGSADGSDATPNPNMFIAEGGNVGIGTTSPDDLLHVLGGDVDPSIKLENNRSGHNGHYLMEHRGSSLKLQSTGSATVPMRFVQQNTDVMIISGSNVGIGEMTPPSRLSIAGDGTKEEGLMMSGDDGTQYLSLYVDAANPSRYFKLQHNSSYGGIQILDSAGNRDGYFFADANGPGLAASNGYTALQTRTGAGGSAANTITHIYGKVGVGTTSPSYTVDVVKNEADHNYVAVTNTSAGTSSVAGFRAHSQTADLFLLGNADNRTTTKFGIAQGGYSQITTTNGNGLLFGNTQSAPIIFGTNDTERMRITDAGNVGIGTTSPSNLLHLKGGKIEIEKSDGSKHLLIDENSIRTTTTNDLSIFTNGNSDQLVLDQGGNVGIGTNSPGAQLDIHQTADDTALEIAGYDDKSGVTAKLHVRSNGLSRFQGSTDAQVQSAAGSIYLSSSEHMYLDVGTRNTYSHIFRDDTGEFARFRNAALCIGSTATANGAPLHVLEDGTNNLVANFLSADGIAEIRIGDNSKYTRLLTVGSQYKIMPGDGAEMFVLDAAAYRTTLKGESGGNSPKLTFDNPDASNDIQLTQGDAGWFGLSTDGGSTQHFIARTGNIGIGTESPVRKLEVNSSTIDIVAKFASSDNRATIDLTDDDTSRYINTENSAISLGPNSSLHSNNLNIVGSPAKVGIGTTSPSTALHLTSATASEPVITIENTNADNNPPGLTFFKNTASPASSDQVGSIKFDSKEATSGDTKTYWEIQSRINDPTNTTPNGQLNFYGLDGDSPGFIHQFQFINSQFSVLNSDGIGPTIAPTGTNGGMFKTQGNKMRLQAKSDSTGEIHMMANTVGIGTTSPQQALHVAGNITTNALDSEYRFGNRSDLLIRGHSDFDMELISPQDMAFSIDSDNNETAHKFLFKTNTTTPRSAGTTLMEISEAGDVSITGGLGVTGSTLAVQKEMKNDVSGDFTLSTSYSHYKVAALTGDAPTNITVTLTAPSSPRIGDEYTIVTECGDSPAANPSFANTYTATVRIIANTGQTINMVNTNININSIQSATLKYNMAKLICIDSNAFALIVSDIGPVA